MRAVLDDVFREFGGGGAWGCPGFGVFTRGVDLDVDVQGCVFEVGESTSAGFELVCFFDGVD